MNSGASRNEYTLLCNSGKRLFHCLCTAASFLESSCGVRVHVQIHSFVMPSAEDSDKGGHEMGVVWKDTNEELSKEEEESYEGGLSRKEKGASEKQKGSCSVENGPIRESYVLLSLRKENCRGKDVSLRSWMPEYSTISGGDVVMEARRNWLFWLDRTGTTTVSTRDDRTKQALFRSTTTATSLA